MMARIPLYAMTYKEILGKIPTYGCDDQVSALSHRVHINFKLGYRFRQSSSLCQQVPVSFLCGFDCPSCCQDGGSWDRSLDSALGSPEQVAVHAELRVYWTPSSEYLYWRTFPLSKRKRRREIQLTQALIKQTYTLSLLSRLAFMYGFVRLYVQLKKKVHK